MRYNLSNLIYVNFLGIAFSSIFIGCGSFQNASYYSDGIYGNVTKVSIQRENVSAKANAYSQYFDEKAKQYAWEESPEETYLVNIDSLNSKQTLAEQQSRSQWGGGNKTTEIYIVDNRMDFGLFPFNVNGFYGYNYGFSPYFDYFDPFYNPYWGGFGWNFNSPFYSPFFRGYSRGFNRGFYGSMYGLGYGYAYGGFYSPYYDPFFRQPFMNRNRLFRRNANLPRRSYAQTYRGERSNARSPRVNNSVRNNTRANASVNPNTIQRSVDDGTNRNSRANTNSRFVNGETLEVPNLVRASRTVTARRNIDSQRGQYTGSANNVGRLNGEGGRRYVPSTRSNVRNINSGTSPQNQSVRTPRQNNNSNSSNNRSFSTPRNSPPSRSYNAPSSSSRSSRSATRSGSGASRSSSSGRRQ